VQYAYISNFFSFRMQSKKLEHTYYHKPKPLRKFQYNHTRRKKKKLTQVLVWLPRNREKETSEPSDRIPSSHLFPHISQQPNKTDNKLRAEA
jgi:hypothetical protein